MHIHTHACMHTHTLVFMVNATLHRHNGFILYKPYFISPYNNPKRNLPLTENYVHFYFLKKKTNSVRLIRVLNNGDTENVLINHLLLLIPVSYPCHYTNLCPHKLHKHAHTHTHARTHAHMHKIKKKSKIIGIVYSKRKVCCHLH